ncbi:hypothetical protein DFH08DRAFT_1013557 [Mycena albidolilacea]|uniref:Endo-1,3(4)-beta-glucanase 1 carbohydrate binding domain-containing protein n=1 Tax=Mycena albidolilacea TaxID=1033008 RepID=A0AAD7EMH1_9AGAR|nr:hypothetical protein DFH08DRAFT_1013557 [Mycena albidolilacea]
MARLSFVLAALLSTIVAATDLADCGDARYDPSKYTCFDNDFLCPIDGQVRELRCGDACYSLGRFRYLINPSTVFGVGLTAFSCSNTTLVDNAVIGPDTLLDCGDKRFNSTDYVCHDGDFLCPFVCIDGLSRCLTDTSERRATLRCADGCYDPVKFSCIDGELHGLPPPNPNCVPLGGTFDFGGTSCCPGLLSIADHCRDFCDFSPQLCSKVPG